MKALETVQKISGVIRLLLLTAAFACFLGAGLSLIGWAALLLDGALPEKELANTVLEAMNFSDTTRAHVGLLGLLLRYASHGILLVYAARWLRHIREAGTPFTKVSAKKMSRLGGLLITVPVMVLLIHTGLSGVLGVEQTTGLNLLLPILGALLLCASYAVRYGAELEQMRPAATADEENGEGE